MDKIKILQRKIKIDFKNEKILLQAITHKSFDPNNNYENLEFLGDRVLGLVVSKKLFEIFPCDPKQKSSSVQDWVPFCSFYASIRFETQKSFDMD